MSKKVLSILFVMFCCYGFTIAQETEKSQLHQRAETELSNHHPITSRSVYLQAYKDYFNRGQMKLGLECVAKATELYCSDNSYSDAFDLLTAVAQAINDKSGIEERAKAELQFQVSKERKNLYMKIHRGANALEQLGIMEKYAKESGNAELQNDMLFQKASYYYSTGQNTRGNDVFKKYIAMKDSVNARKSADEIAALKQQIADNEATIADKDSSLTMRWVTIIGLCVLAAALAVALVVGGIILLRYILLSRKQKNIIKLANDNNALKAKFISNISAQLDPTLKKLDTSKPEVKALLDFSSHIQTLSELENSTDEIELEETQLQPFCEELMEQIRGKVAKDVVLHVNAPKMVANINKVYVSHILLHLLKNAAEYTPAEGTISLEYKKRGAHSHQFVVSNTGSFIAEEEQENVFKAFREVRDLTKGDGLGLPTCKQMALKMNGDLNIATEFVKGTRFVLELHD